MDNHDNDGRGQQSCEALYVEHLQIDPGAQLFNTDCRIYFNTLSNSGTIAAPSNLIDLSPCAADFDGNGTREVPDIFAFLSAWFAGLPSADLDGTPGLGVPDIFAFLSAWFAGCP